MKIPQSLELSSILEKLAGKTVSGPGAAAARALMPTSDREAAQLAMRKTMEAETMLIARPGYPIAAFSEINAELKRMKTGATLSAGELLRVMGVFKAAKYAAPLGRDSEAELIPYIASQLFFDDRALRRIEECILSEEEVADGASAELMRIRRAIRKENENIREKLQSMIRGANTSKYLQDAIITQRGGRFVVPVKAEYKGQVPGIVHEKSASGATLFVEPAGVVDANNKIRELEGAERQEVARILAELTAMVAPYREELHADVTLLTELDLLFAKASLGLEMNAAPAAFSEDKSVVINEGRHPLIDPAVVVPVTIRMEDGVQFLVITGPNTGGKTVTLKLVGLFAAMAQTGLFVPAKPPVKLPVFDAVFADIGDEQSIEQSLSTFSAHMKSIIYALRHAGRYSLVLLDELGAGTDPQEGSALAQAVLTEFAGKDCVLIATTHIGELKAFAHSHERFENASMEFNAATLTPTYKLLMGVAGRSNALLISQKLGLRRDIVENARRYMDSEHVEYSKLLEDAEKARARAQKLLDDAARMKGEAKQQKEKSEKQNEKAAEKRKKMLEKANNKATEIIDDARQAAEDAISEAKKLKVQPESERTKTTKQVRDKLQSKKQDIEKHKKMQKKVQALEESEIHAGDTVQIISMDVPATVLEPPNAKGVVKLQAGVMTLEVPGSDLAKAPQTQKDEAVRGSRMILDARRQVPMSLDLHGQAVDDALIVLDKYLDDAFLSGLNTVTIVHGRGTGTLRKGVQNYLRTHPHVQNLRSGDYDEGGVGATIVTLK